MPTWLSASPYKHLTVLVWLALSMAGPGLSLSAAEASALRPPFNLDQVIGQSTAPVGFPVNWGVREGRPVPADYEVDPEITGNPAYREAFTAGLRSLPSLRMDLEVSDLFGPDRGIYSHPLETGSAWERAGIMEWVGEDGTALIRCPVGVRIQGGWNRRPEESPKHSFRLIFRKRYGAGKFEFPLFGKDEPREFDELILRAGCNNTWLHWDAAERRRGDFLRDQWMRDTHAAMGHPAARGRFVHLFLRGLYWGLYNIVERPSAPFVASRMGGKPGHYDVRNGSNVLEGDDIAWKELMRLANADLEKTEPYSQVAERVDLTAFADYMLLNTYGANGDWDGSSNWYAARRRQPAGPFVFFVWDGERTLENPTDSSLSQDADESPPGLFSKLRKNAEFRRLFAERARKHLTGDGVLTPGRAAARYRQLATAIESAVVAESARWGDYRRDTHSYKTGPYELYTRDDHWRPEVQRLLNDYFPRRTTLLISQLKEARLWGGQQPSHSE
ncbi:MAG: CotH kinase family protein [Verrucomicrobiales bacterium]|nr:CotH kinase family protein [Verrucomicrobiales bacterium]